MQARQDVFTSLAGPHVFDLPERMLSIGGNTQPLKVAAAALRTSQSVLGAYCRRLCAHGQAQGGQAAAHKLARLIHAMLTEGEEYADRGHARYEERNRRRVVDNLKRRAVIRAACRADRDCLKTPSADQRLGRSFF